MGSGGRPNRWVLEPLWIAGFWFVPFAIAVFVFYVFTSPTSGAPEFATFAIAIAFVTAFVGLLVRGAIRRPLHPR
jgi:hypothetical protein